MAWEIPGYSWTLVTGADLSAFQFCFASLDTTAAQCKLIAPAAGGRAIGIIQNKPASGKPATIVSSGVSKCKVAAGGVTAGDNAKVATSGAVLTANAGSYSVGIALATGLVGEYVPVFITISGGGGLIA